MLDKSFLQVVLQILLSCFKLLNTLFVQGAVGIRQGFGQDNLVVIESVLRELVCGGLAKDVLVLIVNGWQSVT
jgi:hypothetical protein